MRFIAMGFRTDHTTPITAQCAPKVSAAVMLLVRSHSSLVQVIVTEDFSCLRQVLISQDRATLPRVSIDGNLVVSTAGEA